MKRSVTLLLTCLLLTLTGVTLVLLASGLRKEPMAITPLDRGSMQGQSQETVRAFYESINEVLVTGSTTSLDQLLAPDFRWRTSAPGVTPDRAGLIAYLTSLRVVFPSLQIEPGATVIDGEAAMVHRTIVDSSGGRFVGIPLPSLVVAEGVDQLRIVGGAVATLDGLTDESRFLQPLMEMRALRLSPGPYIVRLSRVRFFPGARISGRANPGAVLLATQKGQLTIERAAPEDGSPAVAGSSTTIAPGETFTLPAGAYDYGIEGSACDITEALVVTLYAPGGGSTTALGIAIHVDPDAAGSLPLASLGSVDRQTLALPRGVSVETLADGMIVFVSSETTMAVGRSVLAPPAEIPEHRVADGEYVVIESGMGEVVFDDGDTRFVRPHQEASAVTTVEAAEDQRSDVQLLPGDSVALAAGATSLVRAPAGEVSMLILTVSSSP